MRLQRTMVANPTGAHSSLTLAICLALTTIVSTAANAQSADGQADGQTHLPASSGTAQNPDPSHTDTGQLEGTQSETEAPADIVVTGTSIRGTAPIGSNVLTLNRKDIVNIGAASTSDLLTKIPQINSFNQTIRPPLGGGSGSNTAPGLRGLDASATLVLLDGHRLVGVAPDPSSLPPAAIERIEVVPDGASAIYGSDAVAGVINIITRRNLNGVEATFRDGPAQHGYNALDTTLAVGKTWTTGNIFAVGGYNWNNGLVNSDLPYFTEDLSARGGVDFRSTNCPAPNIVIGTTNYSPPGYTAGAPAKCSPNADVSLAMRTRRYVLLLNGNQKLTERLSIFGDFQYTDARLIGPSAAPNETFTLTNTNPFFKAPAGTGATTETLLYNARPVIGAPLITSFARALGLTAGFKLDIFGDFQVTGFGNYGWSSNGGVQKAINAGAFANAVAGTTAATALDPFGDGTSAATRAAIADYEIDNLFREKLYDFLLKADGTLVTLPGGPVRIAVGGERRHNDYRGGLTSGSSTAPGAPILTNGTRTTTSAYGEIALPLFSAANALPLLHELSLSGAVRYDHYSDFGDTTNPKFGVSWSPITDLHLRGSYGKSFHAPGLPQKNAGTVAIYFDSFVLVPPGSPFLNTIVLAGGNTSLKPESATTYSFGGNYTPKFVSGLDMGLTYYHITYANQLAGPPIGGDLFTNPAYAKFIEANPPRAEVDAIGATYPIIGSTLPFPAVQQILDLRVQNLSATKTEGLDYNLNYHWTGGDNSWAVGVNGTQITSFKSATSILGPFTQRAGDVRSFIRGGLDWVNGALSAGAAVNYTGGVQIVYATTAGLAATQNVKPFVTGDLHAAYTLPTHGVLGGITFSLIVNNVLGQDPPFVLLDGGFSGSASVTGRQVWFGIQKKF